jgi:hypothetical protein
MDTRSQADLVVNSLETAVAIFHSDQGSPYTSLAGNTPSFAARRCSTGRDPGPHETGHSPLPMRQTMRQTVHGCAGQLRQIRVTIAPGSRTSGTANPALGSLGDTNTRLVDARVANRVLWRAQPCESEADAPGAVRVRPAGARGTFAGWAPDVLPRPRGWTTVASGRGRPPARASGCHDGRRIAGVSNPRRWYKTRHRSARADAGGGPALVSSALPIHSCQGYCLDIQ